MYSFKLIPRSNKSQSGFFLNLDLLEAFSLKPAASFCIAITHSDFQWGNLTNKTVRVKNKNKVVKLR